MNIITFLQSVQQGQEILVSEGESVSEVIKRPVSEVVWNISNLQKEIFLSIIQRTQWDAILREITGIKIPKLIDLASTGLRKYIILAKQPRQKYVLFAKFSLAVTWVYKVDNNPHIFLIRENQHIQEINRHIHRTLNQYGSMFFEENQGQK